LGYAHPDYFLAEVTSAQLSDWIAYAQLEPVGHPVEMESMRQKAQKVKKNIGGFLQSLVKKDGV
jgi:hypothetical protein